MTYILPDTEMTIEKPPVYEGPLKKELTAEAEESSSANVSTGPGYKKESKNVLAGNAPVHVQDLSEVSYSDFMLYNYGPVYQKQHSTTKHVKLRII